MFETCPGKVKECQQSEEYESFEAEFLIDIKATIAAMEEACPVAQTKSLKSCPVFGIKDMLGMDNGIVNSLKGIRVVIHKTDVHVNTLKTTRTDNYKMLANEKVFENDSNNVKDIDNFNTDVDNLLILFWNKSEANNLMANISIFGEERDELSSRLDFETNGTMTQVMISLTIIFTVFLVIICAVRCSQAGRRPNFRLRNQKFLQRL